jgi:diadenosine tetraphosphate (Ap4A) HIT family hydrolase
MTFVLDPRLSSDTLLLAQSELSLLLLMNDRRYAWLILVPTLPDLAELFELSASDRSRLMQESCLVAETLSRAFSAHKINVGALGNVVRQLHVHHVARAVGDPAWPGPVWGHSPRVPYGDGELEPLVSRIRPALSTHFRF